MILLRLSPSHSQYPNTVSHCNSSKVGRLVGMVCTSDMEQKQKEPFREASEEVSREFKTLIDSQHLDSLKQMQNLILGRLQDSNAVLSHFNEYSENCFAEVSGDFSRNTKVLKSMKTDLDYVFLKLRSMKSRILSTYPDAFPNDLERRVLDCRPDLETPH
ncbi:kxDL motif-containing protein LO9-177-like [Humulus lupulus]|uniref:kxDL motif-containing protein LO9-177-like n=1 Tax=Humulus lupulus TaxID=3486 RepID=UPI002B4119A9|nr:kxDL motif-containing protein LO9-177-like [Humulus lupulus]